MSNKEKVVTDKEAAHLARIEEKRLRQVEIETLVADGKQLRRRLHRITSEAKAAKKQFSGLRDSRENREFLNVRIVCIWDAFNKGHWYEAIKSALRLEEDLNSPNASRSDYGDLRCMRL